VRTSFLLLKRGAKGLMEVPESVAAWRCVLEAWPKVSDGGEEKPPGRCLPGGRCQRRTWDRVIPWRVARQQSPPPFHPARGRYRKGRAEGKSKERR
jgi:hypothetical protein